LHRVTAVLLVAVAAVFLFGHDAAPAGQRPFGGVPLAAAGVVASLLGVAGSEPLIPTPVLPFGADIKLAGSLSWAISLPTMFAGFARHSRDRSFAVLGRHRAFVLAVAAGSVAGSFVGGRLLGIAPPGSILSPLLAAVLLVPAVKVWRARPRAA
jgi:uncharacterized membrane protein YfcA